MLYASYEMTFLWAFKDLTEGRLYVAGAIIVQPMFFCYYQSKFRMMENT